MTPVDFVAKWKAAQLKERSAAQEHFTDLCRLLGEPTPAEADPDGDWFCFEKGAGKAGGGDGWADVWRRGCFGWEYKGKGKDLQKAFRQLQLYSPALEYPPLLIVSDIASIVIHTAFTGTVPETHVLTLDDLLDANKRKPLIWAFREPERLRPGTTTHQITVEAAGRFAELATALRARGHAPVAVAHFLHRLLFCLFAEDVELLPGQMFSKLMQAGQRAPAELPHMLRELFGAMANGGRCAFEVIDWFNGGLFDTDDVLPLTQTDIRTLIGLSKLDWSAIEPSIFGTLFERGLDPDKRSQLGAHYTDPGSIMRIVNPVVVEPLRDAWHATKAAMQADRDKAAKAAAKWSAKLAQAETAFDPAAAAEAITERKKAESRGFNQAEKRYRAFLDRLAGFRVLDPACGSGNFLYLALRALKDLEHAVILEAEALGLPRPFPRVGPEAVQGIELNPYAAELARVTVWIGEIQWMLSHGFDLDRNPILKPLGNIENRDAVLIIDAAGNPVEPEWPAADSIIGNPPFLGAARMRGALGNEYTQVLRQAYERRVPGSADLVVYWFEKARQSIAEGKSRYAGLVATNSIRQKANRSILDAIKTTTNIFEAYGDEPWINEGAAVRVSLVCFGEVAGCTLDGERVNGINSDLTAASTFDVNDAKPLSENRSIAFPGSKKHGPFDVPGETARAWLLESNAHSRPNSEVLKPLWNGFDVTRRPRDQWVVDFGATMTETEACRYEGPFSHVAENVKPERERNNRLQYRKYWWRHGEPRVGLRAALSGLERYAAISEKSKHFYFCWLPVSCLPDNRLIVIARSDDTSFGVVSSRIHRAWALRQGSTLEDRPCYTPTTSFQTFPFPEGLTPNLAPADYSNPHAPAIAEAARALNDLRERWLNPPELVKRIPEVVPGYPDRILPVDEAAAKALKKRTLTNLYNARPAWLDNAHKALDAAVAAAYGWTDYSPDLPDDEILSRLLRLNLARSAAEATKAEGDIITGRPKADA
jgi:type II restriction/modification system DNA methylase subunit YeeA